MATQPTEKTWPGVEFSEIKGNRIPGYLNSTQLSAILGTLPVTLHKYARAGVFRPDFRNRKCLFFKIDRIEEIREKWRNRATISQDFAPVRGVITSFGMMLPRVRPKEEVLERLTSTRPKRASRDSSWRTRRRYNLKDLTP